MENLKWFMVSTKGKLENKAKEGIIQAIKKHQRENLFGEIIVPEVEKTEFVKDKKVTKKIPLFPNYILVQMNPTNDALMLVKSVPQVVGFMGTKTKPLSLSDAEVAKIKSQVEGSQKVVVQAKFSVGDLVDIVEGPFSSFNGKVSEIKPEKQKVLVSVSIFGRDTPVELDFSQVKIQKK